MLNKSHRSVVSTYVLIFTPYLKKKDTVVFLRKHLFYSQKKNDLKKNFASLVTAESSKIVKFAIFYTHSIYDSKEQ